MRRLIALAMAMAVPLVAACDRDRGIEAPPRATDTILSPDVASQLAVPIDIPLAELRRAIESELPRRLWSIDQSLDNCVPPQRVEVLGARVKIAPRISCRIVGDVRRGTVRMRGEGDTLVIGLPLDARIGAQRIGGTSLRETATGSALAHARVRVRLGEDWRPRADVALSYGWRDAPHIDFLGQRIAFAREADRSLRPLVAQLERTIERELSRASVRGQAESAWRQAFAVLELNRRNPPVWMRVTPQRVGSGGYRFEGDRLRLTLGVDALTETFVGQQPQPASITPLPGLTRLGRGVEGLSLSMPVVAEYSELEPVLQRALTRRAQRPFILPAVGPVRVSFGTVTLYGTEGGRIALGLPVAITPEQGIAARAGTVRGYVWATAQPVNEPGSVRVAFTGLDVRGDTDSGGADMALALARDPALMDELAASLTQSFERDMADLRGKIERAISGRREGEFAIDANVGTIETGAIVATGQGLYLPVRASGTASIRWRPQ
jgi:hypothetical protein